MNYNVQTMFHIQIKKKKLFSNLHFLPNNLNPTLRIFSTDKLSDMSFAEIIYLSLSLSL